MIGISSRCIGCKKSWLDFPIKHGFSFVEINHAWTDFQFNKSELVKFKKKVKEYNLDVSFHTAGTAFGDEEPLIVRQQLLLLKAEIYAADFVGCQYFITHPPRGLTFETDIQRLNNFFEEILDFSKGYKIQILIENDASGYWREGQNMRRIFDRFPTLKMNLDIGHLNRAINEGMRTTAPDFISLLSDKIVYVHVHDSRGKKGDHSALGEGTAGEIVPLIKTLGVKNWVIETYDFKDALKTRAVLINKFDIN